MDNKEIEFINIFDIIANKEWIKNYNLTNSKNDMELTFKHELNTMQFPYYMDNEIRFNNNDDIYLFTVKLDNDSNKEDNIIDKYGYNHSDKYTIYENINHKTDCIIHNKYLYRLAIDIKEKKLYLCVYNIISGNLIEKKSYVYLRTIYNYLISKLNKLVVIGAKERIINETKYFHYNNIIIYHEINFKMFLKLLQLRIINVYLIGKTNKNYKELNYEFLEFSINKEYIKYLYNYYLHNS